MGGGVSWGGCRVEMRGWGGSGGVGGCRLAVYFGLLGARGGRALFAPCSLRWDWRWLDCKGMGLEQGVCTLLVGVPQRDFHRFLHGRLRVVSCEVGEFLYCFWGVCGPW